MNDKDIKDKAIFVLGLLAAVLAFSAFKEELALVPIKFANTTFSLLSVMLVFAVLLTLSVYFYAMDYLRYTFGPAQNFFLFRTFVPIANFFYFIAMIYPVVVFLIWITSIEPFASLGKQYLPKLLTFDVLIALAAFALGIFNSYTMSKSAKQDMAKAYEALRSFSLQRALELFKNKFYGESVIEVHKTLEEYLRERLFEEKDISTRYIPMRKLVDLAVKNTILDPKYKGAVADLVGMRNSAAHSSKPVSKENAEFALELVRKILESEQE